MLTIQEVIVPLASSLIGGAVVAVINNWLTRRREQDKKLSDLRVEHLLKSWRQIERAASMQNVDSDSERTKRYFELEEAVANILLLGDVEEVNAAKRFAGDPNEQVNPLLNALRHSLRRELKLEPVESLSAFFRVRGDHE